MLTKLQSKLRPLTLPVLIVAMATVSACTPPPLNLSPDAARAFNNTRVVKGLDVLRDAAVTANNQTPPVVSTATTRKVVVYHQSSLRTIASASQSGAWAALSTGLDEVQRNLPDTERRVLKPYFELVKALIDQLVH